MAELIDRIPPQNLDAEMAVLGAMLIEKEAITKALDIINENDFYKDIHRQLFGVIRDLYSENQPADTITVSDKLRSAKIFADVGGAAYLATLMNTVSTAANVEHYAGLVREKSILRQLVSAGSEIVSSAFGNQDSAEEILDRSESILYNIAQRKAAKGFTLVRDLVHPALDMIEKLHTDKNDVPGLRTGFKDIDQMTAGLQKSDLIIIAARPSMGKTALALNIAEHVAMVENKPVALFSLEMSKESLMLRLLCAAARVNSHKTRKGYVGTGGPNSDFVRLSTAGQKLSAAPLYIDDSSSLSVLELRARARRLATELKVQGKDLGLVMIDYLQIMRGGARSESRQQEISEISRSLKGLARDLRVPVIALSQLSRRTEDKGRDGKPQLSDLRESGAIEQDADVVAFIYREGYYKREDPEKEKAATVIIAKQRNGPTGEVNLIFERDYTRFEDFTSAGNE